MKKKIMTAILAVLCVGFVGTAFASQSCNGVTIFSVGANTPINGNISVNLVNTSGAACGAWAKDVKLQFVLSETNTDQTYATLLTAFSLTKKLWVNVGGTTNNSMLLAMTMKQ